MNFKQLNESFDRMFNNLLTEDTYDNFDDFYQAVWGSFLDRYSDENDYIIDQSTQGSRGSTFIVDKADGVAYEIDEREALESIQEIYSNSGTIEDGIETLESIKQLNHSYNWDDTDAEEDEAEDEEDIKTSPSQVREFVSKLSDIYISKSFYNDFFHVVPLEIFKYLFKTSYPKQRIKIMEDGTRQTLYEGLAGKLADDSPFWELAFIEVNCAPRKGVVSIVIGKSLGYYGVMPLNCSISYLDSPSAWKCLTSQQQEIISDLESKHLGKALIFSEEHSVSYLLKKAGIPSGDFSTELSEELARDLMIEFFSKESELDPKPVKLSRFKDILTNSKYGELPVVVKNQSYADDVPIVGYLKDVIKNSNIWSKFVLGFSPKEPVSFLEDSVALKISLENSARMPIYSNTMLGIFSQTFPENFKVYDLIPDIYDEFIQRSKTKKHESLGPINEGTNFKRVARYGEFDNGYVMHNWAKMSDEEAENKAKQMSIKNPDDIYYVAYDDIMDPSSDIRWIAGEPYNYSDVQIKNGKPFIKGVTENLVKSTKNTKLKEDVFYNWKPDTSFAHIKKIYNDVKKRGYKYVNNELEEMHAAMKKVDAKGYTPEQRKQIRSWTEEIWRANRKNESLKESYDDVNSSNAFDVLHDMVELFGCEEMLNALAKAIGTSDLANNLTYICRQYDYDSNPDSVEESLTEEESPKSISDNNNSYPLAFVPTTDVKGKDLTNTLCDVLNKAGIKNCCAKKRGGNYHITVICPSTELGIAKTIIENCGFFKEWLPLNRG